MNKGELTYKIVMQNGRITAWSRMRCFSVASSAPSFSFSATSRMRCLSRLCFRERVSGFISDPDYSMDSDDEPFSVGSTGVFSLSSHGGDSSGRRLVGKDLAGAAGEMKVRGGETSDQEF